MVPVRRKAHRHTWRHIVGGVLATYLGVYTPDQRRDFGHVQAFGQRAGAPVTLILDYIARDEPFPARLGDTAADLDRIAGRPGAKLPDLLAGVRRHNLKGLIWFDKDARGGNSPSSAHKDWRLGGSGGATLRHLLAPTTRTVPGDFPFG